MSNLWQHDRAASATSVGSFAIGWAKPAPFRPWGGNADGSTPDDEPLTDNMVAAEVDAFAEGFEAGRRTAETELAQEREAIANLAASLEALRPEATEPLAALLAETVERLVRQIVGEVAVDPALLMRRAEAAAALIGEETAPARMRIHPDDAAMIDGRRVPVQLVPDASLDRGSIVLETATGWIEDGPAVRLERLRAELDKLGPGDE